MSAHQFQQMHRRDDLSFTIERDIAGLHDEKRRPIGLFWQIEVIDFVNIETGEIERRVIEGIGGRRRAGQPFGAYTRAKKFLTVEQAKAGGLLYLDKAEQRARRRYGQ